MTLIGTNAGNPPGGPAGGDSEHTREIVSRLARESRTLHAAALRGAEWLGIIAIDPATGALLNGTWAPGLAEVKKLVFRNREALFELHEWAGPATARRIIGELGEPDAYDSMYSRDRLQMRYEFASVAKRQLAVMPPDGIYAWRRVDVSFPRDPSGRATIRCAVVILRVRTVTPKPAEPGSAFGDTSQSSLTL